MRIDPTVIAEYVRRLSDADKMLIATCHEYYRGNWRSMLVDLRKLLQQAADTPGSASGVEDVKGKIGRVERLQMDEVAMGVDFGRYLKISTSGTHVTVQQPACAFSEQPYPK